jgi:hypothetical protein
VTFSREFHFQGHGLRAWATPGDIEIFIRPTHRWLVNILPLARVDPATKTAWLAVVPTYHFSPGNAYQVENAIEYLDQPGEWVFNSAEGRLYLWPKRPLAQCDIRAPFLQEFIRVAGIEDKTPVRFVNFQGLHFRHGLRDTWHEGDKGLQHDWEMYDKGNAILRFRQAEDCAVRACDFSSSSGGGVRLDLHCQRITVADNRLNYLGGAGIVLSGYAPGTKDENHDNVVTNNLIHHVGEIYWHAPSIFIAQSGRNLISHNTIHDLPYNGMVISGCRPHEFILHRPLANRREWVSSLRLVECQPFIDKVVAQGNPLDINIYEPLLHARANRIEHNEICRVMLRLGDGNGIYFSAMGNHNIVRRNYLHDIQGDRGYIRLDDNSSPTVIVENVGVRTSMMFVMKGPGEYRNNFAIDCARMTNKKWAETRLDRVIHFTSAKGGASNSRKRGTKGNTESQIFDELECVSNSLIFAPEAIDHAMLGKDLVSADRRCGAKVGMLCADPLFDTAAFEKKMFRFLPGSPCEQLGIQPLDLSKVGATVQDPGSEIRRVTDTNKE